MFASSLLASPSQQPGSRSQYVHQHVLHPKSVLGSSSSVSGDVVATDNNTEKPRFTCSLCGQNFSKAVNLTRHQRVHTGERPFACIACPYEGSRKEHVIKHLSRVHPREWQEIMTTQRMPSFLKNRNTSV